jgi:outer membrane biosynthesis protein TonB
MDPTVTFVVITLLVALVLLLAFILFELRAQAHERDEFEKALLMALFRISKQNLEKHKALAAVLLKALRQLGLEHEVSAAGTQLGEPLGQAARVRLPEDAGGAEAERDENPEDDAAQDPRSSEAKGES